MSATCKSTAVWTATWKYWRKLCASDTWLPQRLTRSVSLRAETSFHPRLVRDYSHCPFLSLSGCYPFYQKDPFILEECPHVYFSGNAPTFGSKLVKGQCLMYELGAVRGGRRGAVPALQKECLSFKFSRTNEGRGGSRMKLCISQTSFGLSPDLSCVVDLYLNSMWSYLKLQWREFLI